MTTERLWIDPDSWQRHGVGPGVPDPSIPATGFKVGDVLLPDDASEEDWHDAARVLLSTHEVVGMRVDDRPITNVEMRAVAMYEQDSIESIVGRFLVSMEHFLESDNGD